MAKGEIARFEQFLLLSLCFSKSCLLQRRQKASIIGKGLTKSVPEVESFINNTTLRCIDDIKKRVIM